MKDFRAKHGRVAASILLRHWFRVNLRTLDMSEKTAIPRCHSWSWCSLIFGEKHSMLKPMISPMFWHIHHILLRSLYPHHIHVMLGFILPKHQRMFYHNRSWLSPKKSAVWNMNFIFPFSWECHDPNWRTPSFFRGVSSNHQPGNHCLTIDLPYIFPRNL